MASWERYGNVEDLLDVHTSWTPCLLLKNRANFFLASLYPFTKHKDKSNIKRYQGITLFSLLKLVWFILDKLLFTSMEYFFPEECLNYFVLRQILEICGHHALQDKPMLSRSRQRSFLLKVLLFSELLLSWWDRKSLKESLKKKNLYFLLHLVISRGNTFLIESYTPISERKPQNQKQQCHKTQIFLKINFHPLFQTFSRHSYTHEGMLKNSWIYLIKFCNVVQVKGLSAFPHRCKYY